MTMLRNNDDSVMAMLEAFVYDPLINWRLLAKAVDEPTVVEGGNVGTAEIRLSRAEKAHAASVDHVTPSALVPLSEPLSVPLSSSVMSVTRRRSIESMSHDDRALNERAISVLRRVKAKLVGSDFQEVRVDVSTQVDLLLKEAQSNMNLCQLYVGW